MNMYPFKYLEWEAENPGSTKYSKLNENLCKKLKEKKSTITYKTFHRFRENYPTSDSLLL